MTKTNMVKMRKILKKCCILLLLLFPITSLLCKATLSSINLDVERTKKKITIQENKNESLTMKVNELKSLANLQAVIDSEGLSYDCSKIKVIALLNE